MGVIIVIVIICAAGALGGLVNALLTDNNVMLPQSKDGVLKAGIVGNIIVSAAAGLIAWGSTTDVAKIVLCTASGCANAEGNLLSIGMLVASILVGAGGARVLTSEIDKRSMVKQQAVIEDQKIQLAKNKPA